MPNQQPKFNLKYILIVAVLATIVGGGILTYTYWWLPKHEIKPPEITAQNETANWQTYRNQKYDYEFKFPQTIDLVEMGIGYTLANENSDNIVLVDKNTNKDIFTVMVPNLTREEVNLSIDDFINKVAKGFDKKEDLKLGDDNAVKLIFGKYTEGSDQGINISSFSSVEDKGIVIFVKHNQAFILFELLKVSNEALFNQILSTFKFIK